MPAKITFNTKKQYYSLQTSNTESIKFIIDYFSSNKESIRYFKGIKAYDFLIWVSSFKEYKGNYSALKKYQELMRIIKTFIYFV